MPEFGRAEICDALDELSEALAWDRRRAHVHMMGGSAMIMLYGRRSLTGDIDVAIAEGHGPVLDAVRKIAARRGWPSTWLNEQAAMYRPQAPDPAPRPLYSSPSLVVMGASPEYMLAMKLQAARGADAEDLRLLLDLCGVSAPKDALALHDRLFPDRPAGDRQRRFLAMVLAGGRPNPEDGPADAPEPPPGGRG